MTENIFQKGCLVQLSVSKWGGVKKVDKNALADMVNTTDQEWLTATKKLVSPQSLKPLCKIGYSARTWLYYRSLPFPIPGLSFIPRDLINTVDDKLVQFKSDFHQAVECFIDDYNDLRENARHFLGDLFNEVDYPVNISSRFKFAWRFVVLDIPNGDSKILAPEVYAREKEKFLETMEEARMMGINALREEFASIVGHISERFTNAGDSKPKMFKNSTVDSFYDYFQTFKDRNIFEDSDLSALVESAQGILNGTSADMIRSDVDLKEKIRVDMTDIEASMAELLKRPRRRIVMD